MNKGDHDGFQTLHPKHAYQELFGPHKVTYDSEYAYYTRKLFKQIEARYPAAERHVAKTTINGNNNIVEDEVLYIDKPSKTIVAIKQYWEVDDYLIDEDETGEIEQVPVPTPEESPLEDDPKKVRIGKNSSFQAKVTLFTQLDSPELQKFFKKVTSKKHKIKVKERQLNIVCFNSMDGMYLKSFKTNKIDINLDENYNDDFKEVSEAIIDKLSQKGGNGIVLFHSDPGCGKTTYLRYLTQKITKKRLIYLPPDMAHKLADPDFMGFMMNYPDSILIIEDGENCLQKRDVGGNQAVSNLLNNSDGLLGDALKLQIVCTFNCNVSQIDPALMRPGRLIAEYKFEKLSKEKTSALIKKLYGGDSEHLYRVEPMTLAEIYNLDKKKFSTQKKTSGVGFFGNR